MAVITVCVALVVAGVVMVVRWGGDPHEAPAELRLRSIAVALAAGLAAGVLAAGAGGRLVMRLLAATTPEAEGSVTEANEIVARISVDGTLGLIIFAGLPAGLLSGALYALLRPVLPRGRAGGVALGVLLLVLVGTRIEPMRADNADFALVGPAWLAVLAYTALGLFHGMLVAAVAARMSKVSSPGRSVAYGRRAVTVGRIAVAVVLVAALPGFVAAVADILESG